MPPGGTLIDLLFGLPGPVDLSIELDLVSRCPNGDEFELGGHNCSP